MKWLIQAGKRTTYAHFFAQMMIFNVWKNTHWFPSIRRTTAQMRLEHLLGSKVYKATISFVDRMQRGLCMCVYMRDLYTTYPLLLHCCCCFGCYFFSISGGEFRCRIVARVASEHFCCRSNRTLHLISTYVCTLLVHRVRDIFIYIDGFSLFIVIVIFLCSKNANTLILLEKRWNGTHQPMCSFISVEFGAILCICHLILWATRVATCFFNIDFTRILCASLNCLFIQEDMHQKNQMTWNNFFGERTEIPVIYTFN